MNKLSPVLLVALGLLVGIPAARLATAPPAPVAVAVPAAKAAVQPAEAPAETPAEIEAARDGETCQPATGKTAAPHSWCDPVRLLRDFLGLRQDLAKTRGDHLKEILAAAKADDYDLRFMVALVPAPPDQRLDQALEAIQKGFAQSESSRSIPPRPDYLLDRVWLPWADADAAKARSAQKAPGLLLFRGSAPHSLAMVFLISETPKSGIQKRAFAGALDLIADLQDAAIEPEVAILGPSFSGSVESLRLAILGWRTRRGDLPGLTLKAASGSATAAGLDEVFSDLDVSFCRTVLPDDTLHDEAFAFLSGQMGWDLRRVALLTEADTDYGQKFLATEKQEEDQPGQTRAHPPVVMIPFPSHISDLRNAVEGVEKAQAPKAAVENPIPPDHPVLDLDLSDRDPAGDLVPTFSPLTTYSNDLMLSNLLGTIAREGIRYVGIVATDVKDKLFLAEEVRRLAPDVVLFTFDNNLLYAYPQYAETTDGMLVFSSAPLFTQGAPWLPASPEDRRGTLRRQFSGEFQQGVFEAVRYLLGARPVPVPQAWISAVGNGAMWPIARLADRTSPGSAASRLCGTRVPSGLNEAGSASVGSGFAGKDDLQILLVAVILCLLARGLNRAALLETVAGAPRDPVLGSRRLLVMGAVLLAGAAGVLLAVGSIPLWARLFTPSPRVALISAQWAYLLALTLTYALLVRNAARAAHGERIDPLRGTAWSLGSALAFALIILGIWEVCVPGNQIQFFHLRARALASGLSPLVPLSAVGGAVYVWLRSELLRRRLMVRLATDCPLDALADPALAGSQPILESFRELLAHTFPSGFRSWALPLVAFGPPVFLLWWTVQPIGETKGFGRLFVLFLAGALALSALSFYRFVRLWQGTRRLLHRLDEASPAVAQSFEEISKEVDWRPIKSFGWQLPPFRTLVLSAQKLRLLVDAGRLTVERYPDSLDVPLKAMFETERDGGSVQEIENRNALGRLFARACLDLRGQLGEPDVRQFLALRVTAYLRYLFAHMRNCLIGALTSWLLALLAITAYVFEPKHFVSLAAWLALALAVGVIAWIFLQMDRNPTLSRIGGTTPGQVTFDRVFLTKLLTYVGIPALGLIATQFPQIGRVLGTVVGQLLRIGGGG